MADVKDVIEMDSIDLCPHCHRHAVEEREHAEKCPRRRVVGMGDSPPVTKPFDVQPLTMPNLK